MSEQSKIAIPPAVRAEVTALTRAPSHAPIHGNSVDPVAGLRPHPGPVRLGTTVWVQASGHWRPAVVLRESLVRGGKAGPVRVVHSTPSNPTRMYVKNERVENLRVKA